MFSKNFWPWSQSPYDFKIFCHAFPMLSKYFDLHHTFSMFSNIFLSWSLSQCFRPWSHFPTVVSFEGNARGCLSRGKILEPARTRVETGSKNLLAGEKWEEKWELENNNWTKSKNSACLLSLFGVVVGVDEDDWQLQLKSMKRQIKTKSKAFQSYRKSFCK